MSLNQKFRNACHDGDLKAIKEYLAQGAKIHTWDDYGLRWAVKNEYFEIAKFLLENGANIHANNDQALRSAALNGHLETVKFLVENGADIHAENDTALRWTKDQGHTEIVNYLKQVAKHGVKKSIEMPIMRMRIRKGS